MTMTKIVTAGNGHHFFDGKDYHADTAFLNGVKNSGMGSLDHLGFGEFYLKTKDGDEVQFDRMRGKDFPGKSGRSHKLYDNKNGKLVNQLIQVMEKKGLSKLVKANNKIDKKAWKPWDLQKASWARANEGAKTVVQSLTVAAKLFDLGMSDEAVKVVKSSFNVQASKSQDLMEAAKKLQSVEFHLTKAKAGDLVKVVKGLIDQISKRI